MNVEWPYEPTADDLIDAAEEWLDRNRARQMNDDLIEMMARAMAKEAGTALLMSDRGWITLAHAALAAIEAAGHVVVPREQLVRVVDYAKTAPSANFSSAIDDLYNELHPPVKKGDGLQGPFHPYHAYSSNIVTDKEP